MTTKCTKPVKRVSGEVYRDRSKYRNIVVTIYPAGFLGLRLQGTRREETLPIVTAYEQAVKARVALERMQKGKERKARRVNRW